MIRDSEKKGKFNIKLENPEFSWHLNIEHLVKFFVENLKKRVFALKKSLKKSKVFFIFYFS
jgi:hypothetical protein